MNFSGEMYDIREELVTYRLLLNELVKRWQMAIKELTEGNLAIGLVIPEMLTNTNFRQGERAIPRDALNLYYRLELVEAIWAAEDGLFIQLNPPAAGRSGLY